MFSTILGQPAAHLPPKGFVEPFSFKVIILVQQKASLLCQIQSLRRAYSNDSEVIEILFNGKWSKILKQVVLSFYLLVWSLM